MSSNRELKVNLLDVLEILVRRKWFILGITFAVTAAVAVYSMVVKERFMSEAVLLPPTDNEVSSLKSIIGNTPLGKIGGLDAIATSMPNDLSTIYLAILSSRSIRRDLVKQFDLVKVYEFDKRPRYTEEELLKVVNRNISYKRNRDGTFLISASDEDPKRAAAMTAFLVSQLDDIYKRLMNEKNHRYRVFLGERVELVKKDLVQAEKNLVSFQKKHRMIDIESQAKATVSTGVGLEARVLALRGTLESARRIYSDDHPRVREMRIQLNELEAQQRRLADEKVSDFLLPYQQGPDLALEYLQLAREHEIQQTIFQLMVQQHEEAKFEESRNTPNVQVLDPANVPEKRIYPKRRKMVQLAFAMSFVLASLFVLVTEAASRFRRSHPEDSARFGRLLRQAWSIRSR